MTEIAAKVSPPQSINGHNESRRRAPPRSARHTANPEPSVPAPLPAKPLAKAEKKTEKNKPPARSKTVDPNRETVVTESGLALHPNGTRTFFLI